MSRKKLNYDLYLIESPFQLLCANEARYLLGSDDKPSIIIVKFTRSKQNNIQLKKLLENADYDKVILLPNLYAITASDFLLITLMFIWKLRGRSFHNIFIGEVKNIVLNSFRRNLKNHKALFLDDGIATIAIQKHVSDNRSVSELVEENPKLARIRNLYARILGIKLSTEGIPNFFTCFDLLPIGNQELIRNRFSYIKDEASLDFIKHRETVFFIGGPISEDGKLTEDDEVAMIGTVATHYAEKGIKMFYCSHRRESSGKLEKIVNLDNVLGIRKGEFPLEVDFIFKGEGVSHIAAFISTALFTLSGIFELKSANMFSVPDHKWKPDYLPVYHVTRQNYASAKNINLIDLEELGNTK